jgi:hypothetical protein
VLGIVLGVAGRQIGTGATPAPQAITSPIPSMTARAIQASVTSFDPSPGGSGFNEQGQVWQTQTYRSAKFGNLKAGAGLVLDLGAAKQLVAVTVNAVNGPLTMELRSADSAATALSGYSLVGSGTSATGTVTFPATSGGKHRYWLIWVTGLASSNGGFSAELRSPTAITPKS